jgi:hypothetical protein
MLAAAISGPEHVTEALRHICHAVNQLRKAVNELIQNKGFARASYFS